MSFSCVLQVNASEDTRLTKDLTTITTLDGVLKQETSILTPTIVFEYPLTVMAGANYMTIAAFGRSYFITDIRSVTAVLTEVTLRVDVLGTYQNGIRACTAIVGRQETRWNLYLDDGSFRVYSNPNVLTRAFPSHFGDDFYFVLAVAGDQSSS